MHMDRLILLDIRRSRAIAALDALGPMPTLSRTGLRQLRHRDADAWEQQAAAIGRAFVAGVWQDAQCGDNVCRGYLQSMLHPDAPIYDERPIDDAALDAFTSQITARWTESLRHLDLTEAAL